MITQFDRKIRYDCRKAIKRGGKIVGWRLYVSGGILGTLHFIGYLWSHKND